jgi:hypothetical protein
MLCLVKLDLLTNYFFYHVGTSTIDEIEFVVYYDQYNVNFPGYPRQWIKEASDFKVSSYHVEIPCHWDSRNIMRP